MPRFAFRFAFLAAFVAALPLVAAAESKSAAAYLPDDLVAVFTIHGGVDQVDRVREWVESSDLLDSELGRQVTDSPQFAQARLVLAGIAATAGVDPWKAVGAALGAELAVGVRADGVSGKPRIVMVLVPRDAALVDRLVGLVHGLVGIRTAKAGDNSAKPDAKSRTIEGVTAYEIGPELLQCKINDALVLSNSDKLLGDAIRAAGGKARIDQTTSWTDARKQIPEGANASAWVNVAAVRKLMSPDRLAEKQAVPLAAFLFGDWYHAIRHAEQALAWIEPTEHGLAAELRVRSAEALPETHRGFVPSRAPSTTWSAVELPRYMAEIRADRDWAALISEREALLTLAGASDVVNFTNTLNNLLGGMDAIGDVVSKIAGPVRLIVADQKLAAGDPTPSPQLPAFALVLPFDANDVARLTPRLYSLSTMSASIINFVLAQNGQPTYLVDVDRYRDQKIVFATFADPPAGDSMKMDSAAKAPAASAPSSATAQSDEARSKSRAHIRHNFAPAAAVCDGQYIIASTRAMLQDIIDRILDAKSKAVAAKNGDSLALDVRSLTALLRKNVNELVTNRMLEQDASREQARREIEMFYHLLDYFDGVRLSSDRAGGQYKARIELSLHKR